MNLKHLCECINTVIYPSIQDVLRQLTNTNVCTGTQCFETQEDAFGITTTTPNPTNQTNTIFYALMFYMMVIALIIKRKTKVNQGKNRPVVLANSSRHY